MGNVPISCCRLSKSPVQSDKTKSTGVRKGQDGKYSKKSRDLTHGANQLNGQGEVFEAGLHPSHILQHISEREPDDSSSSVNRFEISYESRGSKINMTKLMKSSSCSTIFIDGSTISQPNLDQTIQCVSLAIYNHISNRKMGRSEEIFDESIHPLKVPIITPQTTDGDLLQADQTSNIGRKIIHPTSCLDEPTLDIVHNFVATLFEAAELTSEYAITTLIYLERLMTYAEIDLTPKTWRRMFLGAIVLSSKVWEDQAVWNVDYAHILEEISVEDINELERQFLELIEFNMNVPSSVYARYYFHLRTLAMKNGMSGNQYLLKLREASRLEAMSNTPSSDWQSSPIRRKTAPAAKRCSSLDRQTLIAQSRAVLM